jgi:hypothetical protein
MLGVSGYNTRSIFLRSTIAMSNSLYKGCLALLSATRKWYDTDTTVRYVFGARDKLHRITHYYPPSDTRSLLLSLIEASVGDIRHGR